MATIFVISSIVAVIGAVLMVLRKNPIYGLIFLLVSFCGAAGVFYSLSATFVAVSQILVYAGAIAVLFLFVLMFIDLGKKGEEKLPTRVDSLSVYEPAAVTQTVGTEEERFKFSYPAAVVALAVFAIFAWVAVELPEESFGAFEPLPIHGPGGPILEKPGQKGTEIYFGSTTAIGRSLLDSKGSFPGFALHYEVVGLVILVGVMGAVILGRRIGEEQEEEAKRKKAAQEADSSDADTAEAHH